MTKPVTNFAVSVRARLLDATRKRKGDFQLTLHRYVAERFLYRLGASALRDRFVLKGAMLFVLWDSTILRPTRDLDLAGYWENDAASLKTAFREICAVPCPRDGLEFDVEKLTIEPIRDAAEYHGLLPPGERAERGDAATSRGEYVQRGAAAPVQPEER